MQTRLSYPKTIKFRTDLEFNQSIQSVNLILKKITVSSYTTNKNIFWR